MAERPYDAAAWGERLDPAYDPDRSAVAALVLGVLGLVLCGILAPVAWF